MARILFGFYGDSIVLLYGFIKKRQQTPQYDIEIAIKRLRMLKEE